MGLIYVGLDIKQNLLTKNNCYKAGVIIKPIGIMVHSTACPGAPAKNFLTSWNVPKPNGKSVCVHAFIDTTGIYQTLPFNYKGWHAGGNANSMGYIGFEICEPKNYGDREYFEVVKRKAVEFCAYLCMTYNIPVKKVITHAEGYKQGIASNHSDINHWWLSYMGYSMSDFRTEVSKEIERLTKPKGVEDTMTEQELDKLIEKRVAVKIKEYFEKMAELPDFSEWSKEDMMRAIEMGITDGSRPHAFTTREECAVMAKRAAEYLANLG